MIKLSLREKRIAKILAYGNLGATNKEIASIVGVSEQVVKNALSDIFEKFQARDRIHFCLMMNAPLNSPLLENYNVA